jgi:hypothetical protein
LVWATAVLALTSVTNKTAIARTGRLALWFMVFSHKSSGVVQSADSPSFSSSALASFKSAVSKPSVNHL